MKKYYQNNSKIVSYHGQKTCSRRLNNSVRNYGKNTDQMSSMKVTKIQNSFICWKPKRSRKIENKNKVMISKCGHFHKVQKWECVLPTNLSQTDVIESIKTWNQLSFN